MCWEVEYTDEFGDWWVELDEYEQDSIAGMREEPRWLNHSRIY